MAELANMTIANRRLQLAQQSQARASDADAHDAAVVGGAIALDQTPLLELVEEPGDVGGAGNKPRGQIERPQRVWMLRPQQPQRVVLLGGEVPAGEKLVFEHPQAIVGSPEVEVGFLLERVEAAGGAGFPVRERHSLGIITVQTIVV